MKNPSQWKWFRPLVILVWTLLLNLFLVQKFIGSNWKSLTITLAWLGCTLITWQLMAQWSEKWRARYPDVTQTRQRILGTFSGYLVIEVVSQVFFFLLMYFARWDWEVFTLKEYSIYITLCVVTLFAVGAIYELIYSLNQYGIALQEEEAIKKKALQNQFDNLKNQVNPHFLFNSLNSLSALVEEDRVQAGAFLDELSSVYRYLLHTSENGLASLKSESEFIQSYLFLTSTRYGSAIEVEVNIDESCAHCMVPMLTLQTLVDNAIRNNVVMKQKPLKLSIATQGRQLEVRNSIQPKHVKAAREGLETLISRFRDLNLDEPMLFDDGETFTVRIPVGAIRNQFETT
ncbi:MAG: histidine kinase [Dyadobacter sp.]|uniref:sensor histidine kinase n=1 Tax=Dyadobacter sp. TaxID=1914288 RepID=UPI001B02B20F|nr:histidine kinase [Dyadobacter sp.]MBO9612955.1 histidine kinase [Dyadobacter sp.]